MATGIVNLEGSVTIIHHEGGDPTPPQPNPKNMLEAPRNLNIREDESAINMSWVNPPDLMSGTTVLAAWVRTVVVRKIGSEPSNRFDGDVVFIADTSNSRNDGSTTYWSDKNVNIQNRYFYKLFAISNEGAVTPSVALWGTPKKKKITKFVPSWALIQSLYFNGTEKRIFGQIGNQSRPIYVYLDQFSDYIGYIGEYTAANPGTYQCTIYLKDKSQICWDDGTTDDIVICWSIKKVKLSLDSSELSLTDENQKEIKIVKENNYIAYKMNTITVNVKIRNVNIINFKIDKGITDSSEFEQYIKEKFNQDSIKLSFDNTNDSDLQKNCSIVPNGYTYESGALIYKFNIVKTNSSIKEGNVKFTISMKDNDFIECNEVRPVQLSLNNRYSIMGITIDQNTGIITLSSMNTVEFDFGNSSKEQLEKIFNDFIGNKIFCKVFDGLSHQPPDFVKSLKMTREYDNIIDCYNDGYNINVNRDYWTMFPFRHVIITNDNDVVDINIIKDNLISDEESITNPLKFKEMLQGFEENFGNHKFYDFFVKSPKLQILCSNFMISTFPLLYELQPNGSRDTIEKSKKVMEHFVNDNENFKYSESYNTIISDINVGNFIYQEASKMNNEHEYMPHCTDNISNLLNIKSIPQIDSFTIFPIDGEDGCFIYSKYQTNLYFSAVLKSMVIHKHNKTLKEKYFISNFLTHMCFFEPENNAFVTNSQNSSIQNLCRVLKYKNDVYRSMDYFYSFVSIQKQTYLLLLFKIRNFISNSYYYARKLYHYGTEINVSIAELLHMIDENNTKAKILLSKSKIDKITINAYTPQAYTKNIVIHSITYNFEYLSNLFDLDIGFKIFKPFSNIFINNFLIKKDYSVSNFDPISALINTNTNGQSLYGYISGLIQYPTDMTYIFKSEKLYTMYEKVLPMHSFDGSFATKLLFSNEFVLFPKSFDNGSEYRNIMISFLSKPTTESNTILLSSHYNSFSQNKIFINNAIRDKAIWRLSSVGSFEYTFLPQIKKTDWSVVNELICSLFSTNFATICPHGGVNVDTMEIQ